MTVETIKRANMTTCSRCHTERKLPEGRRAMTGICSDCMRELEFEIKKDAFVRPKSLQKAILPQPERA